MLFVHVAGAFLLCWTGQRVSAQGSETDGQQLVPTSDPTATGDAASSNSVRNATDTGKGQSIKAPSVATGPPHSPGDTPCFLDDVFAALRDATGKDGGVTNGSLAQFGICSVSDTPSVLSELAMATKGKQRNGLEVLHPTRVLLAEDDNSGALTLAVDVSQSPLLKLKPVLLLAFESVFRAGDLDVTFMSQSLHPATQDVCISEGTRYIMLTGKSSEGELQRWSLSVETKSPDKGQRLKEILIGGKSGTNVGLTPFLLFISERGTNARYKDSGSPQSSSDSSSFLCELKRFLGDVLPQDHLGSSPVQLDSLQSLPSVPLGLSSSETLLAGLLNSSAPTILSFNSRSSAFKALRRELALSPALLEEIRLRLEQSVLQITEILTEEDVGHRAVKRLSRLMELSTFPKKEPAAGESQYCAFILLKALQTVSRAYEVQRGLRATRAGSNSPQRENVCSLKSLTVSFRRLLVDPNTATINNCHGSCAFPLVQTSNHAFLLDSHIKDGNADERAPCCVPSAYDPLEVVDLNDEGTFVSVKPSMVAKECECR